jgi:ABC-type Fe3+/spermidine/putrescine transport system ATPase subunit
MLQETASIVEQSRTISGLRPDTGQSGSISLRGIEKRWHRFVALADVDLEVRAGEFFSILGPSGSGKSTLLKIIAGFERPSAGSIHLDGKDVTLLAANRRDVNTVFQNYALFPHMTVGQNIAYPLLVKGLPKAEVAQRVDEALDLVELTDLSARLPEELSGGQKQRAALARALIGRPRVLLLDEPLSALDRRLRVQMQEVLTALHRKLGLTFVFVTHDQGEALSMSDRIAVMINGRLVGLDTPAQLYWKPQNRAVASFFGQTNLIRGIVESDGRTFRAEAARSLQLTLTGKTTPGRCTAAIKAEAIDLVAPTHGTNAARVAKVVFHGAHTEVQLDAGMPLVAQQKSAPSRLIQEDQAVTMEIDLEGVTILRD